jgi:hypothetical protein
MVEVWYVIVRYRSVGMEDLSERDAADTALVFGLRRHGTSRHQDYQSLADSRANCLEKPPILSPAITITA